MSPLHVGVDADNVLHDRRGIGRYARALLQRWLQNPPSQLRVSLLVPHLFPRLVARDLAQRIGVESVDAYRRSDATRIGLDVLWYPWSGMTWFAPITSVATVHDVWPFASPAHDPRIRHHEQTPFYATAARAAAIITDSYFSKSEIIRYLHVPDEKISVVHLGVDVPAAQTDRGPLLDGAARYVLFVGEAEERKDLQTLTRALARLDDPLRTTTGLVIVGKAAPSQRRIGGVRHGNPPVLHFETRDSVNTIVTGEIRDDLLGQLYAGAAALVFPSTYEGFGLPVLEAMARGVPVVASNAASIPEVGGDAALYFPAGDEGALAAALQLVLSDTKLAAHLSAAGRARAAQMSWDRCAQETLAQLRAAALRGVTR